MRDLIIVGAEGHAKDVYCNALACGRVVKGFLDDGGVDSVMGLQVLGGSEDWVKFSGCAFIVGIGDPRIRRRVVERMNRLGKPVWDTLVHPSLVTFNDASIGEGTIVMAGSNFATDAKVGAHCVISLMVIVGHDSDVGDYCTLAPKATVLGNVTCQTGVEVGSLAAVRQGVTLAKGSLLGMGGILTKNTDPDTVYIGNPAKPYKVLSPF